MNKKAGPSYIIVYVTVKSEELARKIATAVLKRRQAACINIVPGVESHFWWQDKLETERELLLICKTKEALLPELVKSVKKIHGDSVPEIIAVPVTGGSRDYLEWIEAETV